MRPERRELIRISYTLIEPVADKAGLLLYERLFDLAPTLRALFKGDIKGQSVHIMAVVGAVVDSLDDMEARMLPYLRELGRRHADYGVEAPHYALAGEALLWAFEQSVGDAFTSEMKAAWSEAYEIIAAPLKNGAGEAFEK